MKLSEETIKRMNAIEDYYYDNYIMTYRFFRRRDNEVQFSLIGDDEPIKVLRTEDELKSYLSDLEAALHLN